MFIKRENKGVDEKDTRFEGYDLKMKVNSPSTNGGIIYASFEIKKTHKGGMQVKFARNKILNEDKKRQLWVFNDTVTNLQDPKKVPINVWIPQTNYFLQKVPSSVC